VSVKATSIEAGQMRLDVRNWLQRSITIFISYLWIAKVFKAQNLRHVNIFQKGKYFPWDIEDSQRTALAESIFTGRDVRCPVRNR
jgi:hypothetical protein